MRAADRSLMPVVILEFDDVLAETRPHRLAALRAALKREGMELGEERFEALCPGLSFEAALHALSRSGDTFLEPVAQSLAAHHADREFATTAARGFRLAPGARDFVLASAGVARLAIVTRSSRRDVDVTLALSDLTQAFECVIALEDYSGAEPSPTPFTSVITRLASRSAVTIGDSVALVASINAVAAARAARFRPIVVGPVLPNVAFAGDACLPTIEGVRVHDLVRLAEQARAK